MGLSGPTFQMTWLDLFGQVELLILLAWTHDLSLCLFGGGKIKRRKINSIVIYSTSFMFRRL